MRDCFGVNVDPAHIDSAIAAGVRHFRVSIPWYVCDDGQRFDFAWARPMMQAINDCGGTALVNCFATPQYLEPSWPKIPGWSESDPPAIAIMRPQWVPRWQAFLVELSTLYPWASYNIATETTLPELWADPDNPRNNGKAQRYVDLVLKPASDVLKAKGCRIVAPGTTMRSEDWTEALAHVGIFLQHADLFDQLDLHVYRETGAETVAVMQRLLTILDGQTLAISESGFAAGDSAQLRAWQTVWDFLQFNKSSQNIKTIYAYRWYGGNDLAAMVREDGTLRPSAEELKRRLNVQ